MHDPDIWQTAAHAARFEFLSMAARGVAHAEVSEHPELDRVVITVHRPRLAVPEVEVEFFGPGNISLGGVAV